MGHWPAGHIWGAAVRTQPEEGSCPAGLEAEMPICLNLPCFHLQCSCRRDFRGWGSLPRSVKTAGAGWMCDQAVWPLPGPERGSSGSPGQRVVPEDLVLSQVLWQSSFRAASCSGKHDSCVHIWKKYKGSCWISCVPHTRRWEWLCPCSRWFCPWEIGSLCSASFMWIKSVIYRVWIQRLHKVGVGSGPIGKTAEMRVLGD